MINTEINTEIDYLINHTIIEIQFHLTWEWNKNMSQKF